MHDLAVSERGAQLLQRLPDGVDALSYLFRRQHGNVVFSKIYTSLHGGNEIDQLLLYRLQAFGECTFKLLGGDFGLIERLRFDEIADGLSLRKIDAAVEEGAHGEFAGFGQPGAGCSRQLDYVA